jgi:hypothetical protein
MVGPPSAATPWLDDVIARVGADPAYAELRHASHRETKRLLAADGREHPGAYTFSRSGFFARPLPRAAVDALIHHLAGERTTGQLRMLDFTPWGGAYNRVRPDATAFVHRAELFLLHHQAVVDPQGSAAARHWLGASYGLTTAWRSGGVYQNFPDPELTDSARAYAWIAAGWLSHLLTDPHWAKLSAAGAGASPRGPRTAMHPAGVPGAVRWPAPGSARCCLVRRDVLGKS